MSSDTAVNLENISKNYLIYDKPHHRLYQFLLSRIKLPGVKKRIKNFYREYRALKDISLEIKKGEIIGVVGRNGSGKSTLLQIICGIMLPSSGRLLVNGRISALLELGAGFNPEFTGIENIYLSAAIQGMEKSEIEAKLDSIIKFANIGEYISQPVKTYSSGMYVRLAFAVAIASDPDILVIDEALAVGDEAFQRKCFARIAEIKKGGGTIIFVSHSARNIIELCDRAVFIDQGEKLLCGKPKYVIAQYHRFIFTGENKRQEVLAEIKSGKFSGAGKFSEENIAANDNIHDSALESESVVSYASQGAEIMEPKLLDKDGKEVNILTRGQSYRFCYRVKFGKDCLGVKFGMMIKTASGIELGGSSTSTDNEAIREIKAGCVYEISFNFNASLLPGSYFLNCGCSGVINGERTFLHRLADVKMFKIAEESRLRQTGIIDFDISPEMRDVP